jgi:[ribosomal protein S5]-alanine N-acetyltransferase
MTITTRRLQLVPFSPPQLLALIDGTQQFEQQFGMPAAEGLREFFVVGDVSADWLSQLRSAPPIADLWRFGFAVVGVESNSVIGTAGFKGPADEQGIVEIAYGIAPASQGRGYATEAASALVEFAFRHDDIRLVRAHTLPEANASTRVLTRCGFRHCGEVIDPDDGRVWRWELARRSEETN